MSSGLFLKPWHREHAGVDEVVYSSKLKTLFVCSFLWLSSAIAFFVYRLVVGLPVTFTGPSLLIITGAVFYLLLAFYIRRSRSLVPSSALFHVALYLAITMGTIETGGVGSPLLFAYSSLALIVFAVNGSRWGTFCILFVGASIIAIGLLQGMFANFFGGFEGGSGQQRFVVVVVILNIIFPALLLAAEKDRLRSYVSNLEKRQSSFVIMRRLNHEIGNALNIALGYLELAREEERAELLKPVKRNVEKIQVMIEEMSSLTSKRDLVGFLEENRDAIAILEELKKQAQIDPKALNALSKNSE